MVEAGKEKAVLFLVYFSILLDNLLLTVVVPIVPDYLVSVEMHKENMPAWLLTNNNESLEFLNNNKCRSSQLAREGDSRHSCSNGLAVVIRLGYWAIMKMIFRSILLEDQLKEENGKVGILLSSKAVVQLVFNPIVGFAARYLGYTMPLFFGTINLLASSLLYALGEGYLSLFLARSLQGLSSACIGVSGMCLVAEHYPDEGRRSKVMGIVLGAVALGVLLGYPYGGFSYDFLGKMAPFLGIGLLALLDIADTGWNITTEHREGSVNQGTIRCRCEKLEIANFNSHHT